MELRTDARANHDRIVQAATEAFAERGLGVEMKEIADRAGVAIGTIYRHFPSKEDLIAAIAHTMLDQIAACIATANAADNPIDGLAQLIRDNIGGLAHFGWLPSALVGGQLPRVHLDQIHAEMEASGVKHRFTPLIERGIREGYLRPDLSVSIAASMLEGATVPWNCATLLQGRTPQEAADEILRLFLHGAAASQQHEQGEDQPAAGVAL